MNIVVKKLMKCILLLLVMIFLASFVFALNSTDESFVELTGNVPTSTAYLDDNVTGDGIITLVPNESVDVYCYGTASDLDGLSDIANVEAVIFWDYGAIDRDYNNHTRYFYRNDSCDFSYSTGEWNCSFDMWFMAVNATWDCYVNITNVDSQYYNNTINAEAQVEDLLSFYIYNDTIDFGLRAVGVEYDAYDQIYAFNTGNIRFYPMIDFWEANATEGNEIDSEAAFNCSYGQIMTSDIVANSSAGRPYSTSSHLRGVGTYQHDSLFTVNGGTGVTWPRANWFYLGMYIPLGSAGGYCTGVMTIIANPFPQL